MRIQALKGTIRLHCIDANVSCLFVDSMSDVRAEVFFSKPPRGTRRASARAIRLKQSATVGGGYVQAYSRHGLAVLARLTLGQAVRVHFGQEVNQRHLLAFPLLLVGQHIFVGITIRIGRERGN